MNITTFEKPLSPSMLFAALFLVLGPWLPSAQSQMLPAYPEARLKCMPYENSKGERGLSTFYYGRDGVLRNSCWHLLDKSRYSANYHLQDGENREIEKYREFSDQVTSTELYSYDAVGRRIREDFKRSDGVKGTALFHWDEQNRLTSTECKNYKAWFTGLIVYEYDKAQRSGAALHRDSRLIGTIAYTYDKEGRLTREHWDIKGKFSQTFTYIYEPIPDKVFAFSSPFAAMNAGFRVKTEDYDFNKEGGGPSHYTYDHEGKLEKKVFERADGLKTVTIYQFDDRGDLTGSHRKYLDGKTASFTYTFDSKGCLTKRSFKHSDGREGFETYAYDRLGRLEKGVYRNMDFWLNGTLTFSHDPWGHLAEGRFKGEDGFDADLEFTTDDHGNVLRMHWKFSFGKTQTYTFEYEPL